MGSTEFSDALFEHDMLDPASNILLAQRLKTLPVLQPFWTLEQYRALDFGVWSLNGCLPSHGRYMKHLWMLDSYLHQYGHVLATREVMDALATQLSGTGPVLDAGCGSGYLSREFARLGIETFAVDNGDKNLPIHQRDAHGDAAAHVTDRFGAYRVGIVSRGCAGRLHLASPRRAELQCRVGGRVSPSHCSPREDVRCTVSLVSTGVSWREPIGLAKYWFVSCSA